MKQKLRRGPLFPVSKPQPMAETDDMSAIKTLSTEATAASGDSSGWLLFAAWIIALVATLSALFIGEVLGQEPCNLCWYQRIAMFPQALLLGIAILFNDTTVRRYALPLAMAGVGIALWHSLVYLGVVSTAIIPCSAEGPSCTGDGMTILGGIPLPVISLACFVVITILLFLLPGTNRNE